MDTYPIPESKAISHPWKFKAKSEHSTADKMLPAIATDVEFEDQCILK